MPQGEAAPVPDTVAGVEGLLHSGVSHHRDGDFALALHFYRRALAFLPTQIDALHLAGVALHQLGRPTEALATLDAALRIDGRCARAHNSRGAVLAALGRFEAAVEAHRRALDVQPHYPEAAANLAAALEDLGRLDAAADAFAMALEQDAANVRVRFRLALLRRRARRLQEAAALLAAVVSAEPGHVDAWRVLAITLRTLRHPDAELCLRRALIDTPHDAELGAHLCSLLLEEDRAGDAAAVAARIEAGGRSADPLFQFAHGCALYRLGHLEAAVVRFRCAVDGDPEMASAFNNLGLALMDLLCFDAAVAVLERAAALRPDDGMPVNNLGTIHDGRGRLDQAFRCYRKALVLRPENGRAWNNAGGVQAAWQRSRRAVEYRYRALALMPDLIDGWTNLGSDRLALDRIADAETVLRRALRLAPAHAAARTVLAMVLQTAGRMDLSLVHHRRAVASDPGYAVACANLGVHLIHADSPVAERWLVRALTIDPATPQARHNRGLLKLKAGDLVAGWEGYRSRLAARGYAERPIPAPRWDGGDPRGTCILVWREQGVGDEILFASCLPDLIARAGRVILECDLRLVSLFARSFPGAEVRAETALPNGRETVPPGAVDAHCPMGDLPRLVRSSLASFPSRRPWLVPDPERVAVWRQRIDALGHGLKVGICWRSQLMTTDRRGAYTRIADWGPVFAVPGIVLVGLQYDDCAHEIADAKRRFGADIHRWDDLDLKDDFEGTAAMIACLDLVITPATSVGELAGALGVPVWRLGGSDWTALGTGVRPWFTSMRLIQPAPGETVGGTLPRVARDLRRLAAFRRTETTAPTAFDEAVAAWQAGDAQRAEALVRMVLAGQPDHAAVLHLLGVIWRRTGDSAAAAMALERAVAVAPANAGAYAALATVRRKQDRVHAAGAAARRALRLQPDLPGVHDVLADLAPQEQSPQRVAAVRRRAAALAPDASDALANLGKAMIAVDRFEAAATCLRHALRVAPDLAAAWTNLGNAEEGRGKPAAAALAHRRAITLDPGLAEAYGNAALLHDRAERIDEATVLYARSLSVGPQYAEAHLNLGMMWLRLGRLRPGWVEYDWRFVTQERSEQARRLAAKPWRGGNIAAARLLVWREQGVGDEILFASTYADLIRRAGHTVIECDARLVGLFRRSFPTATVRPVSDDPRDADAHVPAGSIARYLRGALSRFPVRASWLTPDPARVAVWRARLAALGPGLRVGIAWRSQLVTAARASAYVEVHALAPLFAVPGIVFVNVQYGPVGEELSAAERRFGVTVHRWSDLDLKGDFDGTAALMANLDLVVSPATSAGELAAAVGVPVWRFGVRDWTQLGSGVRPWYPTMRLFQPRPGEPLAAVLSPMAAALRRLTPMAAPEGDADAVLAEGAKHHEAGRMAEAALLYERVLEVMPDHPVALHLSGLLLLQNGAVGEALPRLRAALFQRPDYGAALVSLGHALLASDRAAAAASAFRRALALQPGSAAALTNFGNALERLDRLSSAETAHGRALVVDPGLVAAWDNRGVVRLRRGDGDAAAADHRAAIQRHAETASAWLNLGMALRRLGRRNDAVVAVRRAVALAPALADAAANLGRLLVETEGAGAALRWTGRALAIDPDEPAARFNQGVVRLGQGALAEGWKGYDARFRARALTSAARPADRPAWGGESLAGRRILVWGEQGIGDVLMFATVLPDLVARAGRVELECDSRLVPLLARSFPTAAVHPPADGPMDVDVQAAIGSLPRYLRPGLAAFAAAAAPLAVDAAEAGRWRARLGPLGPGLRLGVAWRSGVMTGDRIGEYTTLADWGPVLTLAGVHAVNLQYGDCAAELEEAEGRFGVRIHRWPDIDLRDDLDRVAALMSVLDLVIAPATSVGELAAAVGAPTWRFGPPGDWTRLGTAVRPWFPTMRIFATRPGEPTAACLPRIAAKLRRLAVGRGHARSM